MDPQQNQSAPISVPLTEGLSAAQKAEMERARQEWARRMDKFRQQKKPKRAFN